MKPSVTGNNSSGSSHSQDSRGGNRGGGQTLGQGSLSKDLGNLGVLKCLSQGSEQLGSLSGLFPQGSVESDPEYFLFPEVMNLKKLVTLPEGRRNFAIL